MGVAMWKASTENPSGLSPSFQPVVGPCISKGRSSPSTGVQSCFFTDASTTSWDATYIITCIGFLQYVLPWASTRQARIGWYGQLYNHCVHQPSRRSRRSRSWYCALLAQPDLVPRTNVPHDSPSMVYSSKEGPTSL